MKRYQPAILGGLFIGILSSLPLVSALNACCCLWVIVGGVLTAYLKQQQTPEPLETSDAVLAGLVAGVIGALLSMLGGFLVLSVTGPVWQETLRQQMESNPDVPPQVRDMMMRLFTGGGIMVIWLVVTLPVYAGFAAVGALLGKAMFGKKKAPPPPAPVV